MIGLTIYALVNLGLGRMYGKEIVTYFQGTFNYDGWWIMVPVGIADLLLIIAVLLLLFAYGFTKKWCIFLLLGFLHNFAVCFNVEVTPFVGFMIAIISIIYTALQITR